MNCGRRGRMPRREPVGDAFKRAFRWALGHRTRTAHRPAWTKRRAVLLKSHRSRGVNPLTAHRPKSRADNSQPADPVVGCPIVRLLFAKELTGGVFQFQPIGDAFGVGEGVRFDPTKRVNSDARSEPPAKKDLVYAVLSCRGFPVVVQSGEQGNEGKLASTDP